MIGALNSSPAAALDGAPPVLAAGYRGMAFVIARAVLVPEFAFLAVGFPRATRFEDIRGAVISGRAVGVALTPVNVAVAAPGVGDVSLSVEDVDAR